MTDSMSDRASLIDAIRRWNATHGEPPTFVDIAESARDQAKPGQRPGRALVVTRLARLLPGKVPDRSGGLVALRGVERFAGGNQRITRGGSPGVSRTFPYSATSQAGHDQKAEMAARNQCWTRSR